MKLPVLKAVATTFAFSIENWRDLVRIAWAPFALLTAVGFAFQVYVGSRVAELVARGSALTVADVQSFNTETFFQLYAVNLIVGLLTLMMMSGVLRFVIRGQKPSLPFYVQWGADEWRLLGAFAIVLLTWMLLVVAALLVLAIPAMWLATSGLTILFFPIAIVGVLWFLARSLLVGPATIGEEQIGLRAAWQRSSGQSLRLAAYILLWIAMGAAFQIAVTLLVMPDVAKIMVEMFTWPPRPEITQETNIRIQEAMAANTPFGMFRVLLLSVFGFISGVVGMVSTGIAWRLINEDQPRPATRVPEGSASDIMGF